MAINRVNSKSLAFLEYFKKPLLVLLLILAAYGAFSFWKFRKSQPVDPQKEADKADPNKNLQKIAREVTEGLGTGYWPLFDPRSWTEDDEGVFKLLDPLSQAEFDGVARLYNVVYAKGRDLKNDLAKMLDTEYYSKLNFA